MIAATPVELAIHVAADADGVAVADDTWIAAQVARAGELLAGAEVELSWGAGGAIVPAEIVTVADRDGLAASATPAGVVHVFVVAALADKDVEGAWIRGVHWRYGGKRKGLRGRRYVILSRIAGEDTLAHELGHFFGLPHSEADGNLMKTGRGHGSTLDEEQLKRVRRRARDWARRRGRSDR